jgi:hypothetical protein
VIGTLWVLIVLGGLCCGLVGIQLVVRLGIREVIQRVGWLPACGLAVVVFVLVAAGRALAEASAQRALTRWSARTGWSPVVGRTVWPWTAQQGAADAVTVGSAVGGTAGGFAIVVGQVSWTHDGLGGSVESSTGRGIFAVVRLPGPYPSTSVQRRREAGWPEPEKDAFFRRFRIILTELDLADRLRAPALREAHLAGRVPPWTIAGDELYSVITTRRLLRPGPVAALTGQMLLLLRLLEIEGSPV